MAQARATRPREEPSPVLGAAESVDFDDVPAAIVCARCGSADCLGECFGEDLAQASQVVAIVPWERPGLAWPQRLWATARLATLNHETFFGSLPNGDLLPALRFAFVAELIAVTLHAAFLATTAGVLLPDLAHAVWLDPGLWWVATRGAMIGIPTVASIMVLLHVAHGVGLDWGARRAGGRFRHGLRFGLYSCGWDLVTLPPTGPLLVAFTSGLGAAVAALPLGITVPRRAAVAYLRGVHHLEPKAIQNASRVGGLVSAAALLALFGLALCGLALFGLAQSL